jgi:hypothetical protein
MYCIQILTYFIVEDGLKMLIHLNYSTQPKEFYLVQNAYPVKSIFFSYKMITKL